MYHYDINAVLSLSMPRASFLWAHGINAERNQAFRIAGAINGVDTDKEKQERKERKREFLSGKPSPQGQAIIDRMMGKT